MRNVPSRSGVFSLALDGPGILKTTPAGNGAFNVRVLGTTEDSTLTIAQVRPRYHAVSGLLPIRNISIQSGEIGGINAGAVLLNGSMTPLDSSPSLISFGALGPNAQIDVRGSVGAMAFGEVALGPGGHVVIAGDLTGTGSSGGAGLSVGEMTLQAGQFVIGRDALAPVAIAGDVRLSENGLFSVGRDLAGTLDVGGSVVLDAGGEILVGRNLGGMTVNGDVLVNPQAAGILVNGNMGRTRINGIFRGQGSPSNIDLAVGLNLNGLEVVGGTANQGSIQDANISVGKSLSGLNAAHGIYRSWITAGVAIDGVTVGADGVTAIYNSEIDAGTSITNVQINGDVVSGFPKGDARGYPTRLIAGKVRGPEKNSTPNQGLYLSNGTITNFTIQGALVDAVLAASVAPFGGDGSLPPPPSYNTPPRTCGTPPGAFTNYQAPAGLTGGTTPNFSIRNVGGPNSNVAAWVVPEGQRHACVLENGTVHVTVTGGAISSRTDPFDDTYDFPGVFAVNTEGITR
ncbi:MAG: hypothetical protein U0790_21185 [Isosphaeraceae bacterium]